MQIINDNNSKRGIAKLRKEAQKKLTLLFKRVERLEHQVKILTDKIGDI